MKNKEKERERESTQVWVKRAKPKGCIGINYVSSNTRSISEKERKGNFFKNNKLRKSPHCNNDAD